MRVLLTWLLDFSQKSSEAVNPAGSGVNLPLFQLPQNYHPTPVNNQKVWRVISQVKDADAIKVREQVIISKTRLLHLGTQRRNRFPLGTCADSSPRHIPDRLYLCSRLGQGTGPTLGWLALWDQDGISLGWSDPRH